jgi:hypothetical protein
VVMSLLCPLIVPDRDSIDHVGVATHLITHPSSYPSIIIEYWPVRARVWSSSCLF